MPHSYDVQVIGPLGMLGQAVVRAAEAEGRKVCKEPLRLSELHVAHIQAPVVINCAGIVKQRNASPLAMVGANTYGPVLLAELCEGANARLIHVSTDCVFNKPGPHFEHDAPHPDDFYASSKLAGEVTYGPHLTIRTSFVGHGRYGLLAQLLAGEKVRASKHALWSGHTAPTVAELLLALADRPDITGLLHVPGPYTNRYDLCIMLCNKFWLSHQRVVRDDTYSVDRRLASDRWTSLGLPIPFVLQEQISKLGVS